MATNQNTKRKDKARVVLRKGESQRKDGKYDFRWTSPDGKRHSIYAATLEELREKENDIQRDSLEGIKAEARYVTLNDMFTLWAKVKRGLKDNTFQNYLYLYRQFVEPDFGKSKVSALKKSDVKQFYNTLADERGLQISTIDSVHTVLHQVLDMAVDDCYLRSNPSDNVLRELKKAHQFETNRRKALTVAEQNLLLSYLSKTPKYQHWYPIFAVMLGTGLRVGEATGLRWCDVDLEEGTISVNHTLVNYDHRENNGGKKGHQFYPSGIAFYPIVGKRNGDVSPSRVDHCGSIDVVCERGEAIAYTTIRVTGEMRLFEKNIVIHTDTKIRC